MNSYVYVSIAAGLLFVAAAWAVAVLSDRRRKNPTINDIRWEQAGPVHLSPEFVVHVTYLDGRPDWRGRFQDFDEAVAVARSIIQRRDKTPSPRRFVITVNTGKGKETVVGFRGLSTATVRATDPLPRFQLADHYVHAVCDFPNDRILCASEGYARSVAMTINHASMNQFP